MPDSDRLRRQRWILFWVLAFPYILVYFYRISLAVVAADLAKELKLSPQQLGSLSSILFYVYAAAQLPLGPLIDRVGSRLVIAACGFLTTCGGLIFCRAASMESAMLGRVLIGIGTSAVLMASFAAFSYWFTQRQFGRVSGVMVSIGNLGNLAATAPFALAVTAIGWRNSFLAIAVMQAVATVLVFFLVKDRPPAHPGTPDPVAAPPEPLLAAWRLILGNPDFWLLALMSFFWYGNYMALQGLWGGPYLMQVLKFSREETGRMLMCTSLGFICGSFVLDGVVRTVFRTHKRALCAGQLSLLLLMICFTRQDGGSPLALATLFFAIGLAVSSGVCIYPIIRSMFPVQVIGTALTSLNFFVLMGAALTQQLMGVIIGGFGRSGTVGQAEAYRTAFLFPIAGLAVAVVCFWFARDYGKRGTEE